MMSNTKFLKKNVKENVNSQKDELYKRILSTNFL